MYIHILYKEKIMEFAIIVDVEAMTYLFNYRKTLKNKMKEEKKLLQKKIEELHRLEAQINS